MHRFVDRRISIGRRVMSGPPFGGLVRRPGGMAEEVWLRISKLPSDTRDRVLERACVLYYSGEAATLEDADERALLLEAGISVQRTIAGAA